MSKRYNHMDVRDIKAGEKRLTAVVVEWLYDETPDLSYLDQFKNSRDTEYQKYYKVDQERKAAYDIDWNMTGCQAKATVLVGEGNGFARIQEFTSGGIWGIESDSDDDFKREMEQEELSDLKSYLQIFGVDVTDFDKYLRFESAKKR